MKNIILIGMMGCGKTTAGRLLAQQLGRPFVDCDELMEGHTGRTIAEIFAQDGERGFRSLESQVLEQLSNQEGLVIATGGGAVLEDLGRADAAGRLQQRLQLVQRLVGGVLGPVKDVGVEPGQHGLFYDGFLQRVHKTSKFRKNRKTPAPNRCGRK